MASTNRKERDMGAFNELFVQRENDDPKFAALSFPWTGKMYVEGYKQAVEIIKNAIEQTGGNNGIVYPLAFLCRHALELALKESIIEACRLKGEEPPHEVYQSHYLQNLIKYLEVAYPDVTGPDWDKARKFLETLGRADPNGEFPRFRSTTKGHLIEVRGNVFVGRIVKESLHCLEYLEGLLIEIEMHSQEPS
jgi:hypothetical protein